MSILRALAVNSLLLLISFGLMNLASSYIFWTTTPPTTTSTTLRPFTRTPGLSLPVRNTHPPKCSREVPAILFQHEKDVYPKGNGTTDYFNIIDECCKGYKRYDFDWSKCVPDCGTRCKENGFCAEGGVCRCFNDFVLNHRNNCIESCPLGCPHGQCYLNGTCICNRGYELDPTKKFCIPRCEPRCAHNEYCMEPNKCACEEGYIKAIPDLYRMGCQPVCIPDCGLGRCVAPNQCECFPKAEKRLNRTWCEANCYMRCDNGFCANRTTCVCQNGYRYDVNSTSCLPDCGDECENGVCVSPGECKCFNGYVKWDKKCLAQCEYGCGYYGRCIAPNVCGCAIVDGPFRTFQQCESGYCGGDGRCICKDGKVRFINKCLDSDDIPSYVFMKAHRLNQTLRDEFNLLIGKYFKYLEIETHPHHYFPLAYPGLQYSEYSYD